MLIGKMNHPAKDLCGEIMLASKQGFDFLDLTLEGPAAQRGQLSSDHIRRELRRWGLGVVGHTAYYLPIDSCIDRIQSATVSEIIDDLKFLAQVEAQKVTLHLGVSNPRHMFSLDQEKILWVQAMESLVPVAEGHGIQILLEHFTCSQDAISLLETLFDRFPSLGFHLDVGHANLAQSENATPLLLEKFGDRLAHVHLSDNVGGDDLHLPLYCGKIDWENVIEQLKKVNYDDTITLEVFTNRDDYLMVSKKILVELWIADNETG
jgi:sugar phosphate isomerase/epimerase